MVLSPEIHRQSTEDSASLSPEQVAHAHQKSSELDKSLGFENTNDPSSDEEDLFVSNTDTFNFTPEEYSIIEEKNALINAGLEMETPSPELVQGPIQLETVSCEKLSSDTVQNPPLGAVEIQLPSDVLSMLAAGMYSYYISEGKLCMVPIPSALPTTTQTALFTTPPPANSVSANTSRTRHGSEPLEHVPPAHATPALSDTVCNISTSETVQPNSSDSECGESDSGTEPPNKKYLRKGVGSAHKNGTIGKYSLWDKLSFCEAVRVGDMPMKEAREKYKVPPRRTREWLQEYDVGKMSNLRTQYTQEELKGMYKLKGAGRPIKDPVLEQKLIDYYNELEENLYPISSELLAYECLAHKEDFMGGASSPGFTTRIADYLRNWRKRNLKTLRKPTSTGQKLPEGYEGKWEATSYYFYLKTKGIDPEYAYHGDETRMPVETIPNKVYAQIGAKRVPVRTSGQDKSGLTAFLVQNSYGSKLPLYPILKGDAAASRPGAHTKKNTSSIRQRFQEVIDRKRAERGSHKGWKSLMFWVNEHAYMDQESFLHFGATNWKYRADPSGEFQPQSILLLDDLKTHKTKKVREEFMSLYNTEIIILPGGLTPKAQIMDTHNNRPFKHNLTAKLTKARLEKWKKARAEAAKDPTASKIVPIPQLSREEVIQAALEAWDELDPSLGANAWRAVKLMPYELAKKEGWTPKEAFKDIRHLDHPWQLSSKIRPKDVDSDFDDIEWNNVGAEFYADTVNEAAPVSEQVEFTTPAVVSGKRKDAGEESEPPLQRKPTQSQEIENLQLYSIRKPTLCDVRLFRVLKTILSQHTAAANVTGLGMAIALRIGCCANHATTLACSCTNKLYLRNARLRNLVVLRKWLKLPENLQKLLVVFRRKVRPIPLQRGIAS